MNFYWLYDLPNWLFAVLAVSVFTLFGLIGVYITRKWIRRLHKIDHSHNDIVGYFLSAVTVFYGITLGLVTVGTWDTFSAVQERVDREAQIIASMYRDVSNYPEPWRDELKQDLRDYTRNVIDVSWPQQRRGLVSTESTQFLNNFQTHLITFNPDTLSAQIVQTEVYKQYNNLLEIRRARLNMVTAGLPTSMWSLVILGGLISIIVTMFFDTRSFSMHMWMTGMMSALLGLIVFLVGTLDNPFRGKFSVGSEPLELVYTQLMGETASASEKNDPVATLPEKPRVSKPQKPGQANMQHQSLFNSLFR